MEEDSSSTINSDCDRSSLNEFMANEEALEAMINMLTSQHLVMQNEALVALCIISIIYLKKDNSTSSTLLTKNKNEEIIRLQDRLIKYNVGKKLAELINKTSDSMTKEIVENLQNFANILRTSEKLVAHLEQHNINELLKSIPILTEYCTLWVVVYWKFHEYNADEEMLHSKLTIDSRLRLRRIQAIINYNVKSPRTKPLSLERHYSAVFSS